MNEQIKQLYEQSLIRETGKDHAGNPILVIKQNPEKFAKLIVKECNKIMAKQYQGPIPQDVRHMMLVLQEHFGVE